MSAVIRGSGCGVLAGVAVPVVLGLDQDAEVGAREEHPVPLGALADRRLAVGPLIHLDTAPGTGHALHPPTVLADPHTSRVEPPHPTGPAYLDARRPLAFAHRGGAYHPEIEGLENTLAAFRHAVELGYTYLETDVHVTSDGVLLAFHDTVLDRVTDRTGSIADSTYDEVRQALIGGRERVPTLAELFDAFPGGAVQHRPQVRGRGRVARASSSRSARRGTGCWSARSPAAG